ncbi:MAG: helix-turn-helix transcriptional regulator [Sodaliphilus sp.]|nr:helix-turn-helix transcriptional regulator [Sodaliphilus sp.]
MKKIVEKLREHRSATPSKWRKEAEFRNTNKSWLRYSQQIAMKMLDRMEEQQLTQKALAERMGCSQQYVSKILKGKENLSIETLCKIEEALQMPILAQMAELA